jgi:pyruvate/2-oxoacid:ferredoxin oxidoreductase beta subunit
MVQKERKLPRVFEYFVEKDQFAGGNTYCAGCPAELTVRTIPKVLGKNIVIVHLVVRLQYSTDKIKVPGISCLITHAL